jgi:hypothetical protein
MRESHLASGADRLPDGPKTHFMLQVGYATSSTHTVNWRSS